MKEFLKGGWHFILSFPDSPESRLVAGRLALRDLRGQMVCVCRGGGGDHRNQHIEQSNDHHSEESLFKGTLTHMYNLEVITIN